VAVSSKLEGFNTLYFQKASFPLCCLTESMPFESKSFVVKTYLSVWVNAKFSPEFILSAIKSSGTRWRPDA
jgi:hypothetical protein